MNNNGKYFFIVVSLSKSTHHPTNKKPRLESINHPSGYEPHAASSVFNWLEGEIASI